MTASTINLSVVADRGNRGKSAVLWWVVRTTTTVVFLIGRLTVMVAKMSRFWLSQSHLPSVERPWNASELLPQPACELLASGKGVRMTRLTAVPRAVAAWLDEDRLTALEARMARLEGELERLTAPPAAVVLTAALAAATAGQWATAGEFWRLARTADETAQAAGRPRPELCEALESTDIRTSHALGRWLAGHEGASVQRGPRTANGMLWRISTEDA